MEDASLTFKIIGCAFAVHNALGYGFLEKVYENALKRSLEKSGFVVSQQIPIEVIFEGEQVGMYYADLIVNNAVILEIKAAENLRSEHEAQLINYLKATNIEVGLLLNFGEKPEFKRKVFANERKTHLKG